MKIDIFNRWDNTVIFSHEQPGNTLAITVEKALEFKNNILLDANLYGGDFQDADFHDADLSFVNFHGANLMGANLTNTNLSSGCFNHALVRGANLSYSNLHETDFENANLSNVNFQYSKLSCANLYDADIRNADFTGADLYDIELAGVLLKGANLSVVRDDMWAVLAQNPNEVPALIAALQGGMVDGSESTGECACLIGTLANACHVYFKDMVPEPDERRPAEKFFFLIRKGDTPETSDAAALALQWATEFLTPLSAVLPE